jgi:hypothetical protein
LERAENIRREAYILKDSKDSDRRYGRENDLDLDFVRFLISKGCEYCGVSPEETKMSLDRVDNAKGHLRDNVVPSCTNCNLTRGNMPYEAWIIVAPALRQARERGLLKGWVRKRR